MKVYPFVGHEKGLFLANFPKFWAKEFLTQNFDANGWGFRDLEKMKEFLISIQESNTFISLNSPYETSTGWFENYSKIDKDKRANCIAYCRRNVSADHKTLDDLDPRQLFLDSTIDEKFTPKKLTQSLKLFLQNSPKIAIVDRHNYLTTLNGKPSKFVDFIKE